MEQSLYLIVQFDFPKPYQPEYGTEAKTPHQALDEQDWNEESAFIREETNAYR